MFTIFLALILIALGSDWEKSERAKERRHNEFMALEKKKSRRGKPRQKRTRTVARDSYGRIVMQEITEDLDLDED